MSYTRFDRHANMSGELRGEILDLISDLDFDVDGSFDLRNMLYGLYDGYLYEALDGVENSNLQRILTIVKGYPILNC